ncbi:hypothetical protein TARUN_6790 [Trichoderma arundinaceum]|uniref:Uncharacterized protein n=1 Tax=Trichoderma arundinaceum TaxID=490622 RepID=A0A395NHY5_TRIAR|nr:hypothetical protein TARUN_6790 [Trichoderma arundinaceum]
MARLLPYLLAFATAFVMLQFFPSQARAQATIDNVDDEDATGYSQWVLAESEAGLEPEYWKLLDEEPPELRVKFGRVPGGMVKGWPSKGGFYILGPCFGVELQFLGLDRFHNVPRPSISDPTAAADEEEMHCNKMRQLGATWWENEDDYMNKIYGQPEPTDKDLFVGWPAGGGVWVLNVSRMGASLIGAAGIHNAYNMEERCKAIEQLGGVFYADPKDCPFLDLP